LEDLLSRGIDSLVKLDYLKKHRQIKPEHADISNFKQLIDLENVLDQYQIKTIETEKPKGKSKELANTVNCRIIQLLDIDAAKYYGQGTRWCTAAANDNMFNEYFDRGPLFVIIPKYPIYPGDKYQFWYDKTMFTIFQLMNEKDEELTNITPFNAKYPELKQICQKLDPTPFIFIDSPSEQVQSEAVHQNGYVIKYIENPSEAVQLAAVNQNGYAIKYIENPSEAVQLAAVKENGYSIRLINNPSEEMKLAAVKKEGPAIKYIENPSEAIQLAAVKENAFAILHIKNPTEKVQREAIELNADVIKWIKNPSPSIKKLVDMK
jgi:hypothetical protein